jgi:hypothetical protein
MKILAALLLAQSTLNTLPNLSAPLPTIVPWNNEKGEKIGTAAISGNRIYLRNTEGKLIVQIVVDRDGTRTMYDASGKVLDRRGGPP